MTEPETGDRHASWLELFFDLVVVVAVNQLAHLLHGDAHHGPGGLDIVTFFTLYLAIWLVWTAFTLYSNVVADRVRARAMFLGMAGIATMAAAIPHSMDGRAGVFAAAYLLTTGLGAGAFQRSGTVLLTWTAASQNAGLVPWVASFWVDDRWWKLGLWLFGLLLTLTASILGSRGDQEEMLAQINERRALRARRTRETHWTAMVAARLDAGHLGERLGLFVIIVLGEAMLQVIGAVAEISEWRPGTGEGGLLLLLVVSAFLLLITLWGLNVRHGFAQATRFPPALVLPAHFVVIASVTVVAAGLGAAATGSAEHANPASAWLMCGGVSAFLLVVNLLAGHTRLWAWRALAAGAVGGWGVGALAPGSGTRRRAGGRGGRATAGADQNALTVRRGLTTLELRDERGRLVASPVIGWSAFPECPPGALWSLACQGLEDTDGVVPAAFDLGWVRRRCRQLGGQLGEGGV